MYLSVDITSTIIQLVQLFLDVIYEWFNTWDNIIILNSSIVGVDVSIFDLFVGIMVVGLLIGIFYTRSQIEG